MGKTKTKINCTSCKASNGEGGCSLGFKTRYVRIGFKTDFGPIDNNCPKPTTDKALTKEVRRRNG